MKEKKKIFSIKNIILISENIQTMEDSTKSRALSRSLCHSVLEFRAFVRTLLDAPFSEPFVPLMMRSRSRADVVTLQRRDVETSRRWDVTTFPLVDLCIIDSTS